MPASFAYLFLGLLLAGGTCGHFAETIRYKRSVNYPFNDTKTDDLVELYCSRNDPPTVLKPLEGRITTRFRGKSFYENNQDCQWNISPGPNHRIQIVVDEWTLQYAPPQALCNGYDHIKVTDNRGFAVSWCQDLPIFQSPFYLISRGDKVSVFFQSDHTSPKNVRYPGGILRFRSFDASSCPPNWIEYGNVCFTLKSVAQIWSDGQKTCNLEQANLASIVSQQEFDFLKKTYNGFTGGRVWFGLNDKSVFGTFKWIDDSSVTGAFHILSYLTANQFSHCGHVDFRKGSVGLSDCDTEAAVLCKMEKGKLSKLYPIPLFKTDKGNAEDSKKGRGLLLGVLIPSVLLLLAIIVAVVVYRRRDKFSCFSKTRNSSKRTEEGPDAVVYSRPAQPSAPMESEEHPRFNPPASSQHIAPPTYEEALMSDPAP